MDTDPDRDAQQADFVGSPSEYADAAEAPRWVQAMVKAVAFLPGVLAAFGVLQLVLVVLAVLVACLIAALIVML